MNVLSLIKKNLANCISDGKVFIYDSETLSAVAFLNGLKHEKLDDVKKIIKDNGFKYDNHYECYIFDKNNQAQNTIDRTERNKFISDLIHWKVS